MQAQRWRAAFARDGYATGVARLDDATVAAALDHLEEILGEQPHLGDAPIVAVGPDDPFGRELGADDRLTVPASVLLDGPVTPFGITYLRKSPRGGPGASWHQDAGPWADRLAGRAAVTLWVALDPADAGNGCLRVVPASHTLPVRPLRPEPDGTSLFGVTMDVSGVDVAGAVDVPVPAGGVVAHHPNLVHGSGVNRSDRPRTALAVRYRER